jgi:hypothetical protein
MNETQNYPGNPRVRLYFILCVVLTVGLSVANITFILLTAIGATNAVVMTGFWSCYGLTVLGVAAARRHWSRKCVPVHET